MPAKRRVSYNHNKRGVVSKIPRKILKYLISFVIVVFAVLGCLMVIRENRWKSDNRLTLVTHNADSIVISSIDPVAKEIINIEIPANTEVEVAGNLGKLRLGKIWDLGIQEDRRGELLAATITSHFGLPVTGWVKGHDSNMVEGGVIKTIKNILTLTDTNLSFGDKLSIGIFSLTLENVRRTTISLKETALLKKTTLVDGNDGYLFSGRLPPKIYSYFSDYYFSEKPTRVIIIDSSNDSTKPKLVGEVVEVLGGKVTSIIKGDFPISDSSICTVSPAKDKRSEIISAIFGCTLTNESIEQNYDLTITLGNKFARYY